MTLDKDKDNNHENGNNGNGGLNKPGARTGAGSDGRSTSPDRGGRGQRK